MDIFRSSEALAYDSHLCNFFFQRIKVVAGRME